MDDVMQIKPMLARTLEKSKLEEMLKRDDVVAEEKFDGERNLLHIQKDGSAVVTSRRISKQTGRYAEKSDSVPHLTKAGTWPLELAGVVLDGEMIHPKGFTDTAKVFRSRIERALQLQTECGNIEYVVFDILYDRHGISLLDKTWLSRRTELEFIFSTFQVPQEAKISTVVFENKEEFLNQVWAKNGEGIILKPVKSAYIPGQRSTWVKVKGELTEDVVILSYVYPDMKYTGKYPETWEFWAVNRDDSWERCTKEEAEAFREAGFDTMPVNSSWWHNRLSGMVYGQYVPASRWRKLGCPPTHDTLVVAGQKYELVEFGQVALGDEETSLAVTKEPEIFLGKVMEVKANDRFQNTGRLRHPVFIRWRDDKAVEECIWE